MNNRALPIGCLFDGAQGYDCNAKRVIALAIEYGWDALTRGERQSSMSSDSESVVDDEQDATTYLEDFAPNGHWVGWYEGNFGVWEDESDYDEHEFLHPGDRTAEDDEY